MYQSDQIKLDNLNLTVINTGFFWGDAGIVFGNLPKVIYDKISNPNKDNKIKLYLNSLLIESDTYKILIDSGIGIFGSNQHKPSSNISLKMDDEIIHIKDKLRSMDIDRHSITHVILTHLHPDHCGGVVYFENGCYHPTFPNAVYLIQRREWQTAQSPDELNRVYLKIKPVLRMLQRTDNCLIIDGDYKLNDHIHLIFTGGHSEGLQIVRITSKEDVLYFTSDLIPISKHRHLTIISSQDLSKRETFFAKKKLLSSIGENDILYFYHDKDPIFQLS